MSFLDLTNDGIILVAETFTKSRSLGCLRCMLCTVQSEPAVASGFVAECRHSGVLAAASRRTGVPRVSRNSGRCPGTTRSLPFILGGIRSLFRFLLFPNGNKSLDSVSLYIEVSDNLFSAETKYHVHNPRRTCQGR